MFTVLKEVYKILLLLFSKMVIYISTHDAEQDMRVAMFLNVFMMILIIGVEFLI